VSCHEIQELLHGYVDGELDLVRTLDIERHLRDCPACARAYTQQEALQAALRSSSLSYRLPETLLPRVRAAVRRAANTHARPEGWSWRWLSLGAAVACIAIVLWSVVPIMMGPPVQDPLLQELVASHVRSLMVDHLTDVAASDTHSVKPWFEGKLDFAPQVPDLTTQGFPLVGGRLEYLANRPVAALVYQRRQHVINVFIWPALAPASVPDPMVRRQGYHVAYWHVAGMSYSAVSNLNQGELQEFIRGVQKEMAPARSP
jgi:anti-sigma factor RsiW